MKRLWKVIMPALLLIMTASTLPVLGHAKKKLLPTVTNAQVKHYTHLLAINLKKDDLAGARRAMLMGVDAAAIRPKVQDNGESSNCLYFFPEGEARRCFIWDNERLSYYELRKSSVALIWEAALRYAGKNNGKNGGKPLEGKNPVTRYYKSAGYRVYDQFGSEPVMNKAMVFFDVAMPLAYTRYGHIAPDGHQTYEPGQINFESNENFEHTIVPIPGETIQSPKSAPSAQ